jgi:hypothetical protein
MAGSYEHGNEIMGSILRNEFFDKQQNYHLLINTATWSYLLLS